MIISILLLPFKCLFKALVGVISSIIGIIGFVLALAGKIAELIAVGLGALTTVVMIVMCIVKLLPWLTMLAYFGIIVIFMELSINVQSKVDPKSNISLTVP